MISVIDRDILGFGSRFSIWNVSWNISSAIRRILIGSMIWLDEKNFENFCRNKFRNKTVSRILYGISWMKNPISLYEELANKRFCTIESLPNLLGFPEMVQPRVKSAHFYHLRKLLSKLLKSGCYFWYTSSVKSKPNNISVYLGRSITSNYVT